MGWQRIGPRIVVARPLDELRAAYARTDLVALDLDECIFPGYSQEALGARAAWRLLRKPLRRRDWRLLPRLCLGGAYRAWTRAKQLVGAATPAAQLIAWYERTMRGIPEEYFAQAAGRLPKHSLPLAAETVELLATHAPTGIVTLGLDVVARAYAERWPGLSFFEANTVVFRPGPGGGRVFEGYDRERMLAGGEDKRRAVERRLAQSGASVPTVVGHNDDDVPMARLARERGGLAVGFRPTPRLFDEFDAVAAGPDWESVYALIAILAPKRGPHLRPRLAVL
ncbi:MAG TPA: hypothetical protein VNE39_19840 [Planctomycetota bacterium]|nr:hypothetical protein [Planctomycetota bacterium]